MDITKHAVLVSVGRGIQEKDNIGIAEELAEALGAAVSCSRPVVDAKWLQKSRQVGSSGKTVKPKVYLACGISGAFQHLAGIKGNPFIIAINKNLESPHFPGCRRRHCGRHPGVPARIDQQSPRAARRRGQVRMTMISKKTLNLSLKSLRDFAKKRLPDEVLRELDEKDECPLEVVHHMCSPDQLGIQLLFVPEDCGGFGGGAFDVYLVCEEMAHIDLGVATAVLATFLGSDPITVGATPEQKKHWLSRIAEEGILFAYGATEPEAGSDLGALKTTADPVIKDGKVVGYKINGNKQWISNGGIADAYTVLANTPGGPSWFIVEKDTKGFTHDEPENKHGIRLSNTAALAFSDVYVDADRLVGGVEGQGLHSGAGCLRLHPPDGCRIRLGRRMVRARPCHPVFDQAHSGRSAAFREAGLHPQADRSSRGSPRSRSRCDRGDSRAHRRRQEGSLNTEGAIAKYMATEAGNGAADASIQALGGYGYTHEYMVEKIKRDVRITTIYEGTSEIMEMTIARDRWQLHLKTRGQHYHEQARKFEELHAVNRTSAPTSPPWRCMPLQR